MTLNDKHKIIEMRSNGKSVSEISEILNISKNTVKSFIQRHRNIDVCLNCGASLNHIPHKKHKKFCSDKCRMKWWNGHISEMNHTAVHDHKCEYCGSTFQAYGSKNRKYCSRDCYMKARFGGDKNA